MQQPPGILIARPDGVIRVDAAVAVSHDWVADLSQLFDSLDAPRPRGEAKGGDEPRCTTS